MSSIEFIKKVLVLSVKSGEPDTKRIAKLLNLDTPGFMMDGHTKYGFRPTLEYYIKNLNSDEQNKIRILADRYDADIMSQVETLECVMHDQKELMSNKTPETNEVVIDNFISVISETLKEMRKMFSKELINELRNDKTKNWLRLNERQKAKFLDGEKFNTLISNITYYYCQGIIDAWYKKFNQDHRCVVMLNTVNWLYTDHTFFVFLKLINGLLRNDNPVTLNTIVKTYLINNDNNFTAIQKMLLQLSYFELLSNIQRKRISLLDQASSVAEQEEQFPFAVLRDLSHHLMKRISNSASSISELLNTKTQQVDTQSDIRQFKLLSVQHDTDTSDLSDNSYDETNDSECEPFETGGNLPDDAVIELILRVSTRKFAFNNEIYRDYEQTLKLSTGYDAMLDVADKQMIPILFNVDRAKKSFPIIQLPNKITISTFSHDQPQVQSPRRNESVKQHTINREANSETKNLLSLSSTPNLFEGLAITPHTEELPSTPKPLKTTFALHHIPASPRVLSKSPLSDRGERSTQKSPIKRTLSLNSLTTNKMETRTNLEEPKPSEKERKFSLWRISPRSSSKSTISQGKSDSPKSDSKSIFPWITKKETKKESPKTRKDIPVLDLTEIKYDNDETKSPDKKSGSFFRKS